MPRLLVFTFLGILIHTISVTAQDKSPEIEGQNANVSSDYDQFDVDFPDTIYYQNLQLVSDSSERNLPPDAIIIDTVGKDNLLVYKSGFAIYIRKAFRHYFRTYLICYLEGYDVFEVHLYSKDEVGGKNILRISVTTSFWHGGFCGGGGYNYTYAYFIDLKSMQLICRMPVNNSDISCLNDACNKTDKDSTTVDYGFRCVNEIYSSNEIRIKGSGLLIIPLEISKPDEYTTVEDYRYIKSMVEYAFGKSYLLKIK